VAGVGAAWDEMQIWSKHAEEEALSDSDFFPRLMEQLSLKSEVEKATLPCKGFP
jgi:hypothetical protein